MRTYTYHIYAVHQYGMSTHKYPNTGDHLISYPKL